MVKVSQISQLRILPIALMRSRLGAATSPNCRCSQGSVKPRKHSSGTVFLSSLFVIITSNFAKSQSYTPSSSEGRRGSRFLASPIRPVAVHRRRRHELVDHGLELFLEAFHLLGVALKLAVDFVEIDGFLFLEGVDVAGGCSGCSRSP